MNENQVMYVVIVGLLGLGGAGMLIQQWLDRREEI